jgi:hypothetical protein
MEKPFRVRAKAVWGSRAVLTAVTALALITAGCGKATEGQAPVYLVIENLGGAAGVDPGTFGDYLMSDVLTYVKVNEVLSPTIFQDNGRVTMHVALKDFGRPLSPNPLSAYNQVILERYHVTFIRADGRNTPGVDVPYGFDGVMTGSVGPAASFVFPLVRASAKMEAPLVALVGGGGSQHISCIAQITFYGHDQAGNAISVSGQMTVDFADWGDPT